MLHIVMDGSGDMPPDWAATYDIDVIPIYLHVGDREYVQGVDLSDEGFYNLVDSTRIIPRTAVPSPHQFAAAYRRIAQPGDTILSLHLSSKLSRMFTSAAQAAHDVAGELNVIAYDTLNGSAGLGFMCRDARVLEWAGEPMQSILKHMDFMKANMHIVFTVESLEYARMSGRVRALQATFASLLDIKPIIVLHDGALDMADRVRTRQKALACIVNTLCQRLGDRKVNVAVVHARAPETGQMLLERVRAALNCREAILTNLSIAVSAHLGPGTVGIVAYPVEDAHAA
jgi:DegV family protein with EDD domain